MAVLTKDQIFQTKAKTKTIPVPEWGGDVTVCVLSGELFGKFQDAIFEFQKSEGRKADVYARLVSYCAVNPDGSRMFSDADLPAIMGLPWTSLLSVATACMDLNKANTGDAEEKN